MKRFTVSALIVALFALCAPLFAQNESSATVTPFELATRIRENLFDAQSALMYDGDAGAEEASEAVASGIDAYQTAFRLALGESENAIVIEDALQRASNAAQAGDAVALAAARGAMWTAILRASTEMTFEALAAGDAETASAWLALREFRASTRFSRPGADASLALEGLRAGTVEAETALAAARADLLDTYQSQLNLALADADEAHSRNFATRRAEEIGGAAGYFALLSRYYAEQRGETALNDAQTAFTALQTAVMSDDAPSYESARADIDQVLANFRAAPLSEAEAARRAGQLVRFTALIPVEYERGVRDGRVTLDIEIQEALSFRDGAVAAFNDLEQTLNARDPETTAQVAALLDGTLEQIRAVVPPSELRAAADQIVASITGIVPAEWLASNSDSDADVIVSILDGMLTAAEAGEYRMAESSRLEAYAMLEMGIEQRLRGFAPDLAVRVESLFWQGTVEQRGVGDLLASNAPINEVRGGIAALRSAVLEAQTFLGSMNSAPEAVATNAAIIVFREGLEAVLILASLLASLRSAEERPFRRSLIMGAVAAFAATAVTWWFAHRLLTLLLPLGERLEAIVSLIAIGVLLVITNWFFHKVYWVGWMANFHSRKRQLIGGVAVITLSQTMGLVVLGFTSIYREGFETVLFLQSLVLEAGIGTVLNGVALGLVGVAIIGAITFALQVRLPYKKMLVVTGVFIGFVLLTMVGHTVHTLQSVGWLPITPIQGMFIPFWMGQWIGLYATWQGIILQIISAVFVIGSYFLAEHQNSAKRKQHSVARSRRSDGSNRPAERVVPQPTRVEG